MGERRRLLALKHFVAAVKADQDLHACTVLETCLVEIATGVLPHVESSHLLAIPAYKERLLLWAEQEAGDDRAGGDVAIKQAMKGVSASNVTPRIAKSAAPSAPTKKQQTTGEASAPSVPATSPRSRKQACNRGGGGWLPTAFVQEFNAEGEEVEPEVATYDADLENAGPSSLGQLNVKARVIFSEQAEVSP